MAELFARYESGVPLTAGAIVGSATGVSGLNPMVDRLNSISTDDGIISGTSVNIYANLLTSIDIGSILINSITRDSGGTGGQNPTGSIVLDRESEFLIVHTGSFTWQENGSFLYDIKFSGTALGGGLTSVNTTAYNDDGRIISGVVPFTTISTFTLPSGTTNRWQNYSVGTSAGVENSKSPSNVYMIPTNLATNIVGFV